VGFSEDRNTYFKGTFVMGMIAVNRIKQIERARG
jgi:hypothetical protein